jgi:fermentation-respiration switch protein FrsA (DUF1100 family)|tara:strand:+ start:46664 stop:47476 length:813 start_codon:yes stop_codon:yes gene_type:complete
MAHKKKRLKKMANYLFFFLCAYGGLITYLYSKQREMLYHPHGASAVPAAVSEVYAMDVSNRGFAPKGWYVEASDPSKPTILHFHGNGGNVAMRYDGLQDFIKDGYGLLLAEYSGYGGNTGAPSEKSIYRDAEAYYAYLQYIGLAQSDIVLYGESLGSGPATYLAQKYDAKALVLEVPYDSILSVAKAKYWFVVGLRYLLKDHFDNIGRIDSINMPVLMMLAEHDEVIPISHGKALFLKAKEPKLLRVHHGVGHNGLKRKDVFADVNAFLN